MSPSRILAAVATALALSLLFVLGASAQLPFYTLPSDDFRWNWGDADLDRQRQGFADIEASGGESFFRCELTARTRASSRLSPAEIRQIKNDLQGRLDFVYAVSEAMYYLDQNRDLDWATLDCKKNEAGPSTPEQRAERESEARSKMQRELERRRARDQRSDD